MIIFTPYLKNNVVKLRKTNQPIKKNGGSKNPPVFWKFQKTETKNPSFKTAANPAFRQSELGGTRGHQIGFGLTSDTSYQIFRSFRFIFICNETWLVTLLVKNQGLSQFEWNIVS